MTKTQKLMPLCKTTRGTRGGRGTVRARHVPFVMNENKKHNKTHGFSHTAIIIIEYLVHSKLSGSMQKHKRPGAIKKSKQQGVKKLSPQER